MTFSKSFFIKANLVLPLSFQERGLWGELSFYYSHRVNHTELGRGGGGDRENEDAVRPFGFVLRSRVAESCGNRTVEIEVESG